MATLDPIVAFSTHTENSRLIWGDFLLELRPLLELPLFFTQDISMAKLGEGYTPSQLFLTCLSDVRCGSHGQGQAHQHTHPPYSSASNFHSSRSTTHRYY